MAKPPSPWSVKGVDPEAREAAKTAARKAGLTVGAWLNQMIRQSASGQLRSGGVQQGGTAQPGCGHQNRPEQRTSNEQYFCGNDGWDTPP